MRFKTDEFSIVLKLKELDPVTCKYVFHFYYDAVFRHCRAKIRSYHDTEDITQETFIKVFYKIKTFKGSCTLKTWILKIADNLCLNYLTQKKRAKNFVPYETFEDEVMRGIIYPQGREPGIMEIIEFMQLREILAKGMALLTEEQHNALELFIYKGFTYLEISKETGKSIPAVKSLIHRAREVLQIYFRKQSI